MGSQFYYWFFFTVSNIHDKNVKFIEFMKAFNNVTKYLLFPSVNYLEFVDLIII